MDNDERKKAKAKAIEECEDRIVYLVKQLENARFPEKLFILQAIGSTHAQMDVIKSHACFTDSPSHGSEARTLNKESDDG